MTKIFLIILLILLTSICFASEVIKVLKIYDGSTIEAKIDNGNKFSIRLQGIDCYETTKIHRAYKQAYTDKLDISEVIKKGNNAKVYLRNLNKNTKQAYFDFAGIDKYGRALGIVWFYNLNINEELLKNKLCNPYSFKDL